MNQKVQIKEKIRVWPVTMGIPWSVRLLEYRVTVHTKDTRRTRRDSGVFEQLLAMRIMQDHEGHDGFTKDTMKSHYLRRDLRASIVLVVTLHSLRLDEITSGLAGVLLLFKVSSQGKHDRKMQKHHKDTNINHNPGFKW